MALARFGGNCAPVRPALAWRETSQVGDEYAQIRSGAAGLDAAREAGN